MARVDSGGFCRAPEPAEGLLKRCCQTAVPRELSQFSPWLRKTLGYDMLQLVCDPGGSRATAPGSAPSHQAGGFRDLSSAEAILALFPENFHQNLKNLLTKIILEHVSTWRTEAQANQSEYQETRLPPSPSFLAPARTLPGGQSL
uniref:COMMD9 N-terminal domain-containing protein n=1 Tax=Canis lupus familiaris TaxID=9615 RepID=A0A8C0NY36_CANLF